MWALAACGQAAAGPRRSPSPLPKQALAVHAPRGCGRADRPQERLRAHRAEKLLERVLDVGLPGQSGTQLEPQPWVPRMRPYRLEAHRQEEVDRSDAAGLLVVVGLAEL